jgi:hypothetical protein
MNKKAALAIVVIASAFGLAITLLMATAMIPQAQAFQRPSGEPPGLHKNVYSYPGHACQQQSITKASNPSPVGQSCRD